MSILEQWRSVSLSALDVKEVALRYRAWVVGRHVYQLGMLKIDI